MLTERVLDDDDSEEPRKIAEVLIRKVPDDQQVSSEAGGWRLSLLVCDDEVVSPF